jgi:hypothetical protein
MNTTANQVDGKVETNAAELEALALLEGLKELSSIELAYVGGGTASVSFI